MSMPGEPDPYRDDEDHASASDPVVESAAEAILDGGPVDWPRVTDSSQPAVLAQMRVLADLVGLHRTLQSGPNAVVRPDAEFLPGAKWGSLTLLERLGTGTFGEVFRAWDYRLEREVALKLLYADTEESSHPEASIHEGRLLARVRHPNVVTVYGAERIDGRVGIWTEFIHGHTLADVVREHGRLTAADAAAIGRDVCRALGAVHAAGLAHGDIKAQNVMRENSGRIVLLDFGAGKEHRDGHAADGGANAGTPLYLAPERSAGAPPTPQSDIYSVGVLLFFLTTGSFPTAASVSRTRAPLGDGSMRRMRSLKPDVADVVANAIHRALEREPTKRFSTAASMEAALVGAGTWSPLRLAVTGAIIVAAGGIAWNISSPWRDRPQPPVPAGQAAERVLPLPLDAKPAAAEAPAHGVGANPPNAPAASSAGGDRQTAASPTPPAILASQQKLGLSCNSNCRPSRDGRYFVTGEGDNVMLWEIATAASRAITRYTQADDGLLGTYFAISPDNRFVAYSWGASGADEVRVTEVETSATRTLLSAATGVQYHPIDWTRDGSELLFVANLGDGRWRLALADARDGRQRTVATVTAQLRGASISPDGRFVVFSQQRDPRRPEHDLLIASTDGGTPELLETHPANDFAPLWTPDGTHVFFASDRGGATGGWLLTMSGGRAVQPPIQIIKEFGPVGPIAFADDGTLFYHRDVGDIDVYVQPFDLHGSPAAPERVSPTMVGRHSMPAWSPDGRSLAFITNWPQGHRSLTIRDMRSLSERHIVLPFKISPYVAMPQWSPDGELVVYRGNDAQGRPGYFGTEVATGAVSPILLFDNPRDEGQYSAFQWSPDGQSFFYLHRQRGLVERRIATGAETHRSVPGFEFRLSPDGSSIAVLGTVEKIFTLYVVPLHGAARELMTFNGPLVPALQGWSADGMNVIYTMFTPRVDPTKQPHRVWVVPAAGGAAVETGIAIPAYTQAHRLALSPDGRQVAFTSFTDRVAGEVWQMRNFLPR